MIKLNEIERELWIRFHEFAYRDDLDLSEKIKDSNPRWSIISGYYAMHDIAKLYLGKVHNLKIFGENVHKQTIDGLKYVLKDSEEAKRILELLRNAEKEIKEIGAEQIPYLLISGKKERGKAQYYSINALTDNNEYTKKAEWFIENIVRVFIKILEEMTNAD